MFFLRDGPVRWRSELIVWLPVTVGALLATFAFEHWIIHRQVILPALAISEEIPAWMWATLFVPELVVCFVLGWRFASWRPMLVHAISAAATRDGFGFWLSHAGEPGHAGRLASLSELAFSTPVVAIIYLVVFAFAAESAREPGPAPSLDLRED